MEVKRQQFHQVVRPVHRAVDPGPRPFDHPPLTVAQVEDQELGLTPLDANLPSVLHSLAFLGLDLGADADPSAIDLGDDVLPGHLLARRELTVTEPLQVPGPCRQDLGTYSNLQLPAPNKLPGFMLGKGLTSIGLVTSCVVRDGKETIEFRYYINSLAVNVKQFARSVRGHRGIENGCHWSLDMTFREDEPRLRERHLRENFAWLNRFALSLLKQHPGRQSVVMKRRSCGWSDAVLTEVVTG